MTAVAALSGLVAGPTGGLQREVSETAPLRRVVPNRIELLDAREARRTDAGDPWRLFDADTQRGFLSQKEGPSRFRLLLDKARTIVAVGVFGPAEGRLTVWAEQEGVPVLLQEAELGTVRGWQRFAVPQTAATRALFLEWQPASPGAALPEVELWGSEEENLSEGTRILDATREADGAFRVRLPIDPGAVSRVFLSYELSGLSHWSAAVRSINGLPARGFGAQAASGSSVQVEEIDPRWLRRGSNEVRFQAAFAETLPDQIVSEGRRVRGTFAVDAGEAVPYEVRNLRLVLVEEDGRTSAERGAWNGAAPRELRFARPSQPYALEINVSEGVRGVLTAEALLARGGAAPLLEPVDLGELGPGRHRLPVRDGVPAAVGVRLLWASPEGSLEESGVLASPVGRRAGPRLELTHPPSGDPAADGAYLRGFVEGAGTPELFVNGAQVPGAVEVDGSLGVLVPRPAEVEGPWSVLLELVWPDGSRLTRTLRLGAPADPNGDDSRGDVEREVAPGEAKTLALRGARLEVPAGAVDRKVRLTMRPLATGDLPALDAGMTNVTPGSGGFRMGPHGQRFRKALRLTLPYDPALIPKGLTSDDVRTFFFDEEAGRWTVLPREEVGGASVVSLTDHFTDFINATLTLPDEPAGESFSPNSLQDLAKADPASQIVLIEPPQGGPMGDAALSYPLVVPRGRRGLQPDLAVQYNSGGANGWLGLGWDLQIPSVEVSTLFGVPRYNPSRETETYALGGEQLAPVANPAAARQAERVFTRRVEGSFQRIVRHGSGPASFWWEVTDQNGVRSLFGQTAQARLADPRTGNVFRWYLERVIDLHGNTVDYTYATDAGSDGEPWVQVYPARIDYTGMHGSGAFYQVRFVLDDGAQRPDRISSGRPGFKTLTRRRLAQVEVLAGGELVRRYLFEYREGDFRKSLLAAVAVTGEDGTAELARHGFDYEDAAEAFAAAEAWNGMGSSQDATGTFRAGGGAHGFVGLGPPTGCQPHFGIQVGGSATDTTQKVAFLDVNGDGLPDRIDEDGEVDLNRRGSFEAGSFSGADTPGHTLEWSFDLGLGVHAEAGISASLDASWVWSHANDDHAVADLNGDLRPDLVSTDGGFSARLNDGQSFQERSTWTGFGAGGLDLEAPGEEDQVLSSFRLSDALRKLELPYSGPITIDGAVQKKQAGGDGVVAQIFHNGTRIWRREIGPNDTAPCAPGPGGSCSGGLTVTAAAGDRLYFLAGAIRETSADALLWVPVVTYSDGDPQALEPYGARVHRFDAGEDFRLAGYGGSGWTAIVPGTVHVQGALVKQTTSDDITVRVWKNGDAGSPIYQRTFAAGEEGSFDEVPPIQVAAGDVLFLRIDSTLPVDPHRVRWTPVVIAADGKSEPAQVAFAAPRLLARNRPTRSWTASSAGTQTFDVSWSPAGIFSPGSGTAVLYVQGLHRLYERRELPAHSTSFDVTVDAAAGEPVFFTLLASGPDDPGTLQVDGGDVPVNERYRDDRQDVLFGGWHGWFYGEWNGNVAFNEGGLTPPEGDSGEAPDFVPGAPRWQGVDGFASPAWMAAGFDLYHGAEGLKPSRQGGNAAGELDQASGTVSSGGGGLGVLRKTYAHGWGVGASAGAGLSLSAGESETQLDLLDMNGDLYPDQVSGDGVRFSNGRDGFGGLEGFGGLSSSVRRAEDGNVSLSAGLGIHFTKKNGKGKPSAVLSTLPSVGSTVSLSQTRYDLMDVNGDGLPDRVTMGSGSQAVEVRLNLGYRFGEPEAWPLPAWSGSRPGSCRDVVDYVNSELAGEIQAVDSPDALSFTRSSALHAGVAIGPFGGGVGTTLARTLVELSDVNGDGLPDHVAKEDGEDYFRVKLNRGDGWEPEQPWPIPGWSTSIGDGYNPGGVFRCLDAVSFAGHVEGNGSVGAPICIPLVPPIPVVGLQIEISAQGFGGNGGMQLFFQDLDGDGFADHVLKKAGDPNVYVKRNLASRANLLTAVHRPLGGEIRLAYEAQGNRVGLSVDGERRVDMPSHQWVLASSTVDDGRGNAYTTSYEYFDEAFYDRLERESYGYARVRSTLPDGSTVDLRFHNQDLYRRYLLARMEVADASGRLFRVETDEYEPRTVAPGSVFPARVREETLFYEGTGAAGKSTASTWQYDSFGNVIATHNAADQGSDDDVTAAVAYHVDPQTYVIAPSRLEVRDGAGRLLRERQGDYDEKGDLVRLEQTLIGGKEPATGATYTGARNAVWTLAWDDVGNLASSIDPTGFRADFTYDATTRSLPVEVRDSFGYVSRSTWDLKHSQVTETVDKNGQSIRRAYDGFGRLVRVAGPYDSDASPALAFEYDPTARPAWAVVHHKDATRPDPIDTGLFVDGLGRVLQTKEDAELDLGAGTSTRSGMRVSGRLDFDAKGRVAAQGQPVFDDGPANRFVDVPSKNPTRFTYDVLDRVLEVRYPQGAVTRSAHGFGTLDGTDRFLETRTDPNGRATLFYTDVQGDVLGVQQTNTIGGARRTLLTRYTYDALSQLTAVTDPKGNATRLEHDTLGRNVTLDTPDAGRTEFRYDPAGNLGAKVTANLAAQGQQIRYHHTFHRLDRIDYPVTPDVTFTYGGPGAPDNRADRIATVADESGVEERSYGRLGEVVRTVRTATALNGGTPKGPYTTAFRFDSFGRLLSVTYPDGEELAYGYDAGGQVKTSAGVLGGVRFDYLRHQGYDEFGAKARTVYGNGVETRYAYDPQSRYLAQLQTLEATGREIQDLRYQYDPTGTILAIQNDVPLPSPSQHGGPTSQTFHYDDLYQLVAAEGSYRSAPNKQTTYELALAYDEIGNTVTKSQLHQVGTAGHLHPEKKTTYDWAYTYGGPRPHAPTHIGNRTFHYDLNGNQTGWDHDRNGTRRTNTWDEENRLKSSADNGQTTRFLYDASGMRTNKAGQHGETIYVNRWFSIRNGAIASKHVFADNVRVATKISPDPNPPSEKVYFYQPDHLGSTHFVTDERGTAWQHLEYFPSGEAWVDERSETQRTPFSFSGKELDEETGLSYFGFRYYDARQGQWISPDPILEGMLDTRSLASPDLTESPFRLPGHIYAYVANSPVNLIDPNGLMLSMAELRAQQQEQRKQQLLGYLAEMQQQGITGIDRLRGAYLRSFRNDAFREGYDYQIVYSYGLYVAGELAAVENDYVRGRRADAVLTSGAIVEFKNTSNWGRENEDGVAAWKQFQGELEAYAASGRVLNIQTKQDLPRGIEAMIQHFKSKTDAEWYLNGKRVDAGHYGKFPMQDMNPDEWLKSMKAEDGKDND